MTVTIKDVALRAGVAPITVSRTFSGTHRVAPDTRAKVLSAAGELGYVPDLLARGLVHKRSSIIGMLVLELANPFFAPIIDAVQTVAHQHNHMMIVSQSERQLALEKANLTQLRQMRVAGALVTPAAADVDHLRRMQEMGTAVVLVARTWQDGDYVAIDDRRGGELAGEHLVRLGHRRIACITLNEPDNPTYLKRVQSFHAVLAAEKIVPTMILTSEQRVAAGIQAAHDFLTLRQRPTAAFVTADRMAIGFVHGLRQQGVRVPEDVAVVGYDDIRHAEFTEVPLTTVALPKYEMGKQAAEILFARINESANRSDGNPRQVLLQPELTIRQSCGALAS